MFITHQSAIETLKPLKLITLKVYFSGTIQEVGNIKHRVNSQLLKLMGSKYKREDLSDLRPRL